MRLLLLFSLLAQLTAFGIPHAFATNIGQRTLRLFDQSRQRPIVTEVWYPTADQATEDDKKNLSPFVRSTTVRDGRPRPERLPLILLSHGTGGSRLVLEWLAMGLALRGQVVAAVDHWGNSYDTAVPDYFLRPWERPQDLSFVLTELMRTPGFGSIIDRERVGAIGFSLGGYTVLALAGGAMDLDALYRFSLTDAGRREHDIPEFPRLLEFMHDPSTKERIYAAFRQAPPLRDPRIKAVVALAPAIGQAFTRSAQFPQVHAPVLIVGAESDHIAPVKTNAAHYHELISDSRLVILPGKVGHFVFLNDANQDMRDKLPVLFTDAPSCDRGKIHDEVIALAADFFNEHLALDAAQSVTR